VYGSICLKCFSLPFQLSDSSDDYEFSVEFTKNSRGLGFTVSSYVGDLNSGMELTSFNWSIIDYLITNYIIISPDTLKTITARDGYGTSDHAKCMTLPLCITISLQCIEIIVDMFFQS